MEDLRVFDLHCDTLDALAWPTLPDDLNGGSTTYGHADVPAVAPGELQDFAGFGGHLSLENVKGTLWCQCLAVFVPDTLDVPRSRAFFEHVAATLPAHVATHPDLLDVATDAREIDATIASGRMCGLLTIEGGKLLAASDDMVERISQAGVKMLTLTWNAANPLGSGHNTEQGLTPFGERCVRELEDRRIVVDVSHLNDPGFDDVRRIARRPFVASHSNSRAICDVPRNLTDDQFRAIRDAGGLVGLNFCDWFVTHERKDPTPDDLLAHVEHWLDLDGRDVVALGSDYDGCNPPSWLVPCDKVATLADLLRERFGAELADRLLFSNAHDFFVRNETD
jgi:membrane dipeptidase